MQTRMLAVVCVALVAAGCMDSPETALERLVDARRLTAELHLQFTKVTDAGNRAVMADTDEASVAFAREAEQASSAVQQARAALAPLLTGLLYAEETRLLDEFGSRFAEYLALDRTILGLAVENTNLKAQRLSIGDAQAAVDAFRDGLEAASRQVPEPARWRIEALANGALAAVREIQVLQTPHIAETSDDTMTRLEARMSAAESTTRRALAALTGLVPVPSRPHIAQAATALDQFMAIHARIVVLSRTNTNVRSLALSLGQKRTLTAKCEETLGALQDALAKRGFSATR